MCSGDEAKIIIDIIKTFYYFLKFALPIVLIVFITVDFFKMIITKKDDDNKKIRSLIVQRVIYAIVIFLVPTFIFFTFNTLFGDSIVDVNEVRTCWNSK